MKNLKVYFVHSKQNYLRFTGRLIRLDQNLADSNVLAHVAHRLLHRLAGAQDRHAAYPVAGHSFAVIRNHLRRVHNAVFERQHAERVLDDQPNESFRVEDELVAWRSLVADERVQSLDLWRVRQQVQRVGHRLADVRVGETFA